MNNEQDIRPRLMQRANALLGRLSTSDRETLLIQCWMSHDARWFMAVADECGMPAANRINQVAARAVGKAEAKRFLSALGWESVTNLDDALTAQEAFIGLFGPDLLDFRVTKHGDNTYQIHIDRCFAHDNVQRAGVADAYECGIFARIAGWLDALGLAYEMSPALGPCLQVQGRECVYTIAIENFARENRD